MLYAIEHHQPRIFEEIDIVPVHSLHVGVTAPGWVTSGGTREFMGVPPGPRAIGRPPTVIVVAVLGTGMATVVPPETNVALEADEAGCGFGSVVTL